MGFKRIAARLGGLAASGAALAFAGRIGVFLLFGLIAAALLLVAVIALTGIFGSEPCKTAAQKVLAILLGRHQEGPALSGCERCVEHCPCWHAAGSAGKSVAKSRRGWWRL
jgi:hypothetical protein